MKITLQDKERRQRELHRLSPELMKLAAEHSRKERTHTQLKTSTGEFRPSTIPRMTRKMYLQVFHGHDGLDSLPPTPPDREITAFECFAAALIGVAGANDELEDHQIFFIMRAVPLDLLDTAFLYYECFSMEQLTERMNLVLSIQQRMALISNVLDFAMSDGFYRSNERRFLRLLRDKLKIEDKSYNQIYQVTMTKYDLSSFD